MFGHMVVDGVLVAGVVVDGVAVLAVSVAALLDAVVVVAACAITKLPTPVPASRPTESSAVAAILRSPVRAPDRLFRGRGRWDELVAVHGVVPPWWTDV